MSRPPAGQPSPWHPWQARRVLRSSMHPRVYTLGVAQDGGWPHAGCAKQCCTNPLSGCGRGSATVSCLAVVTPVPVLAKTANTRITVWCLEVMIFDATPDFPAQLRALDAMIARDYYFPEPQAGVEFDWLLHRTNAISGIYVTHAHIGHYTGLMYLGREAMNASAVPVYAGRRMMSFLRTSQPWKQLVALGNIALHHTSDIRSGRESHLRHAVLPAMAKWWKHQLCMSAVIPTTRLLNATLPLAVVRAFPVIHRSEISDCVGFSVDPVGSTARVVYLPDIDAWPAQHTALFDLLSQRVGPQQLQRMPQSAREVLDSDKHVIAYVDATFFCKRELERQGSVPHPSVLDTAQRMSAIGALVCPDASASSPRDCYEHKGRHQVVTDNEVCTISDGVQCGGGASWVCEGVKSLHVRLTHFNHSNPVMTDRLPLLSHALRDTERLSVRTWLSELQSTDEYVSLFEKDTTSSTRAEKKNCTGGTRLQTHSSTDTHKGVLMRGADKCVGFVASGALGSAIHNRYATDHRPSHSHTSDNALGSPSTQTTVVSEKKARDSAQYVGYFDGGCQHNPGPVAAYGWVLVREGAGKDAKVRCGWGCILKKSTNNTAEYEGILRLLAACHALNVRKLRVIGDSQLVIRQLNGQYRCKNQGLLPLYTRAKELARQFDSITFSHVPRHQNKDADGLARLAMAQERRGDFKQRTDMRVDFESENPEDLTEGPSQVIETTGMYTSPQVQKTSQSHVSSRLLNTHAHTQSHPTTTQSHPPTTQSQLSGKKRPRSRAISDSPLRYWCLGLDPLGANVGAKVDIASHLHSRDYYHLRGKRFVLSLGCARENENVSLAKDTLLTHIADDHHLNCLDCPKRA